MKREILLYSDTRSDADILWFSGVQIHDPFFAFTLGDKKCAILSELEIGRARRTSTLDEIFDSASLRNKFKIHARSDIDVLCALLKSKGKKYLTVGGKFPVRTADELRERGFNIEVAKGALFPKRTIKSPYEVKEIEFANTVASAGFFIIEEILRNSKPSGGFLQWNDKPLTSEILRAEVEREAISFGADSMDTIVAGGVQACDPHETGHGGIRVNSLIVADIFPRLRRSGYFGDMTRTFLKGIPSKAQSDLVNAVLEAQARAISQVKAGVNGADIHAEVCEFFESRGYKTTCDNKGAWSGYIHSTGHGVGLDIHEEPRLSLGDCVLRAGEVVTVEPGLYYPKIGGCRIEDNVLVKRGGCKMLSDYHYNWVVG